MNEEKKIDLKDKMLSDDNLDQVSGGKAVSEPWFGWLCECGQINDYSDTICASCHKPK